VTGIAFLNRASVVIGGGTLGISGGTLSHVIRLTTKHTAEIYVATFICSVNARAKISATRICCCGRKVSMMMGDLYNEEICAGVRLLVRAAEARVRVLKIITAIARPMLPPSERSWARAPWVTAVIEGQILVVGGGVWEHGLVW
jgi:hypothetical protein